MSWRASWQQRVRQLKSELRALYLAARDPRTPWYAKALAICVVGYAFSPLDLIPDPIPIIGYLDNAVLLPLGILLTIKLIPDDVLQECRQQVADLPATPTSRWATAIIVSIWLALAAAVALLIRHAMT